MATRAKELRVNFHCQLLFKRPILDITNIGPRFFSMVYDCLAGKIQVNASEFSARVGNTLGEVEWRYNVYGGITSVSMTPNRLAFDFPNLLPNDFPVVIQV